MALTKSLSFSLGRKRILISRNNSDLEQFRADFESNKPSKKHCNGDKEEKLSNYAEHCFSRSNSSSLLEALPQELLIKVICGVNHDDLKKLILLSKTICEAALEAKKSHFAYSTPSKTKAFRNSIDLINCPMDMDDDLEAPNAPKQARRMNRRRFCKKKIDDISVALFADESDDNRSWPRRSLFSEEEES